MLYLWKRKVNTILLMLFTAFAFVPETIRHLTDNHEYWKKAAEDWVSVFVSVFVVTEADALQIVKLYVDGCNCLAGFGVALCTSFPCNDECVFSTEFPFQC